jgi:hypothetical protein
MTDEIVVRAIGEAFFCQVLSIFPSGSPITVVRGVPMVDLSNQAEACSVREIGCSVQI